VRPLRLAAAWFVCALALCMVACAPGVNGFRQAVAETATIVASGYKTLGATDAQVQARIRLQAKSDPEAAQAALDEHLRRYAIAAKALDAGVVAVEAANASAPLVARGIAKSGDIAAWIADLVAVGLSVAAALKDVGVL
jgi:hypothetical protein